ncbi:Hpt domain-containing protein [Lentisalinibacter salinarum]|uniref:Hpt domain-containing protein n=1 Tax=Lentisalinibacter salinarum TaxID=2992239 RepID=UPI0038631049
MSEAAAQTAQALNVVSDELTETLKQARVALEEAVEGHGSRESLLRAGRRLHEAAGVLKMVEVYGGALLAEEMEAVCRYLADLRPGAKGQQDGLDAITRAMVQLPSYLDRLLGGGRDIALVLLPLLNDLRAVRGKPLMSESTLLLLNLTPGQRVGVADRAAPPKEDIVELARKARPAFQLALLGWIQGQHPGQHLKKLRQIALALEQAADRDEIYQLWWVVVGVLEALADGGLETSVSLKRLLGQADRQLKRLIDEGSDAFEQNPPTDLLNNLLYYIARSATAGERVSAIRRAFNLSELLPGDEQVVHARESLAAPSIRLMETVGEAIKEDLGKVKDVLDIYVRTGMDDVADLAPQVDMLKKISDTLGVLGLGDLRGDIQAEIERLRNIVAESVAADETMLLKIASTLLQVEDSLDAKLKRLIRPAGADVDEPGAVEDTAEVEYRQVTEAVLRECIVNMARVKEAITQVTSESGDPMAIDNVPKLVRGVKAGLVMLDKGRAAEVVERLGRFVTRALQAGRQALDPEHLDRLADAVVSIEYYMETVQAGRRDPWYMLDNAEACLDALSGILDEMDGRAARIEETLVASQRLRAIPEPEQPGGAGDATEIIQIPVVAQDAEHLDPELLELFIEESKEEIASIRKQLPRWAENADDMEALITVRRSFHTLKGSGRMVGAERIGDFCWHIEDLLNRLINRTLTRTPPMVEFIERAAAALPELVEQLETGIEPKVDTRQLVVQASAFAEGDPNAPNLAASAVEPEEEPAPVEMDPVLLDIFSKETAAHLGSIKSYIEACREEEPPYPIPDNLHRACHTLHGSVNMADVDRGVTVTASLNQYVRRLYDAGQGMDTDGLAAVEAAVKAIESIVAGINQPGARDEDYQPLVERLRELTAQVESRQAEMDETGERTGISPVPGPEYGAGAALGEQEEPAAGSSPAESAAEAAAPEPTEEAAEAGPAEPSQGEPAAPPPAEPPAAEADYDAEIAAIFTEEAGEILEASDEALASWTGGGRPAESLTELKRHLHTLKGGARMAGITAMGNLSHGLETLLIAIDDDRVQPSQAVDDLLQQSLDELHRMRDMVTGGQRAAPAAGLEARIEALAAGETAPAQPEAPAELETEAPEEEVPEAAAPTEASSEAGEYPALELPEAPEAPEAPETTEAPEEGEVPAGAEVPEPPVGEPVFGVTARGEGEEGLPPEAAEGGLPAETDISEWFAEHGEEIAAEVFGEEAASERGFEAESEAPAEAEAAPERQAEPGLEPEPEPEPEPLREAEPKAETEPRPETEAELEAEPSLETEAERDVEAEPEAPAEEPYAAAEQPVARPPEPPAPAPVRPERAAPPTPAAPERQEFARIDAELLEELLNAAGEISIYHSRLSQQVTSIDFNLAELEQTVSRLRDQLRKLEFETETQILNRHQEERTAQDFDPLELDRYSTIQQLSRALAESASDVASLKDLLQNLATETESLLVQQSRVTAELQDGLMRTRMVPFQRHVPRLSRLVRQIAGETGKRVELAVEGGSGELDRQVLEKMLPPFEHMLRNAIVHGIEPPETRQAAGKPPVGRITVRLHREGSEMVIDVADDGAGLNVDAIRRKATEQGLLTPDSDASDEAVMELILKPGFSTADQLTQSAGRGVGMDVVANEVKKLGGALRITSMPGQGTNFTVRLPFTLAITQALIVRAGEEVYALPLPTVEGVARVARAELDSLLNQPEPTFEYGEQTYRFQHLGMFVGGKPSELPEDDSAVPVILIRAGEKSIALLTDEMLASREIVVKSVGPQLASIRGISGATILGDGRIVLILDMGSLARSTAPLVEIREAPRPSVDERPLVLVVDDSITVRRVTERFLQRQGMRVATAKDGIDAISVMQEHRPDIILLDIEMPRMDGYEFATHVRNDERFADIPIIMITSRVSEKHRARAIEIGVNDYLGKPYQDSQLLEAIHALLEEKGGSGL